LKVVTINGKKLYSPFPDGTNVQFVSGNHYGDSRDGGARLHGGQDFAVPTGTKALAVQPGKVTYSGWDGGYGNFVEITLADNTKLIYAHNSKNLVKVGDTVKAGQTVALTGSTGRSSGPHLHFEVIKPEGKVDPRQWLAVGQGVRQPATVPARTAGVAPPSKGVPRGAVLGADGYYVWGNGKYKPDGTKVGVVTDPTLVGQGYRPSSNTNYTPANPFLGNTVNSRLIKVEPSNSLKNYGYDYMNVERNPQNKAFVQGLHRVAYNLGIPAVWLADIINTETSWNLSSTNTNQFGMQGIIQFSPETRRALEAKLGRKLTGCTPVQQLAFVEEYLNERKGKYKSLEDVSAMVLGGSPLFDQPVWQRAKYTDGNKVTFVEYLRRMGLSVGRKYSTSYDLQSYAPSVHSQYHADCPTCQSLLTAGSFQPHYNNEGTA